MSTSETSPGDAPLLSPMTEAAVRLAAQGHLHQFWYFSNTLDAIRRRLGDHPLVTESAEVVDRLRA